MLSSNQLSLSQISKKATLGLPITTQNVFSSSFATNASFVSGNVTNSFNSQLKNFLRGLNSERDLINKQLQNHLSTDPNYDGLRKKGVELAWKYEKADVMMGGKGTVEEGWTNSEKQQILNDPKGHPKVFDPEFGVEKTPEGHHINNVANHKELQANPDNIRFYKTRAEHVNKGHKGNVNNPSSGELIDKNAHLRQTNRIRVIKNELQGVALSAGIGFGIGFTLSTIAELAIKGIQYTDFSELVIRSTKTGIETAFISVLGYGAGRLTTLGLEKLGIDLASKTGSLINYSGIGLGAIAVISLYQYAKMRMNGIDKEQASSQTIKQSLYSISILAISMLAQGIYGGYAGLIVSSSIGLLYFVKNIKKSIGQREQEERMRIETIKYYKDYILN